MADLEKTVQITAEQIIAEKTVQIEIADLFALREFLKVHYAGEEQPQFALPLRLRHDLEHRNLEQKEKPGLYTITHVHKEVADSSFELRRLQGFSGHYDVLTFYFSNHKFLSPNTISVKIGNIRDTSDANLVKDIGNTLKAKIYRNLISNFELEFS